MKIVVGSKSAVKLEAVKNALIRLGIQADIVGVDTDHAVSVDSPTHADVIGAKASSGVAE